MAPCHSIFTARWERKPPRSRKFSAMLWSPNMKRPPLLILAALALSACGTEAGDRGLSGAGIGAGIGLIGGPPGVVVGGAVGAAVGLVTKPSTVNLGKPAWK